MLDLLHSIWPIACSSDGHITVAWSPGPAMTIAICPQAPRDKLHEFVESCHTEHLSKRSGQTPFRTEDGILTGRWAQEGMHL